MTSDPTDSARECVWDYPRPPRLEPTSKRLVVRFAGREIASTTRGYRVLETSHPPTYYLPPEDVDLEVLRPNARKSFCEWKGVAAYHDVVLGADGAPSAAWSYPEPTPAFSPIRGYLAFYAHLMERCTVNGELVLAQQGDFYGGWRTADLIGPFKGAPGTGHW